MALKSFLGVALALLTAQSSAVLAQRDEAPPAWSPLAAKAGVDSQADRKAPAGALNVGRFNPETWKRSAVWDAPSGGSPIWNPVKLKLKQGGKLTSITVNPDGDPKAYCAAANSGVDFVWTEMQHSAGTWHDVATMWDACPTAKAARGVRVPNANQFDIQHALDMGAMVLIIPTVQSVEEAREAVKWAYYPPMGSRSTGTTTRAYSVFGKVPGKYRNTVNDNLVVIAMIETLGGLKDADKIAAVDGIDAVFAASGDLGNFGGFKEGDPDFERMINIVHDAALRSHKALCGPRTWIGRGDFTCFQGPSVSSSSIKGDINAAYAAAAKEQFGSLLNLPEKQ